MARIRETFKLWKFKLRGMFCKDLTRIPTVPEICLNNGKFKIRRFEVPTVSEYC